VEAVNDAQKGHLFDLMARHYGGATALRGKTVALWGLAFKPNTDDMREASSRRLLQQLWDAGARVRAYDPEAIEETRRIFGERDDLVLCGIGGRRAAGRRRIGGGHRMEAVPQSGFREAQGRACATGWCSTAATSTSRPRSRPPDLRTTASGAGARCARPREACDERRRAIEQRMIDLEMRLAFQEQALQDLSDALAAARDEESRNALLLHRALEELRHLRSAMAASPVAGDAASEPPPPHY
jgi:uncharacterized coiled-coil protein SlyX